LFGVIFYAPEDFEKLARSVRYTVIFFSNYLFAKKTGYFDTGAEFEPLLHTWSLAVEEQYYIVFPAILMIMAKVGRKKLVLCLGALFILSFIVSIISIDINSHRAFFVTEGRVWELLVGSFIALNVFPKTQNITIKNTLSILGLSLIGWAVCFFNKQTVFPGYAALIPAIGAALVIYSGIENSEKLYVAKLLCSKLMVFVGLISYSLYLWHWPLIVFTEHLLIRQPSFYETILLLVLIGVVSFLSWKYIEQPSRKNSFFNNQKKLFKVTVNIMVTFFVVCLVIKATDGLAMRSSKPADVEWEKWGKCNDYSEISVTGGEGCELGKIGGAPGFMLWGDSHARAIAPGVSLSAENYGQSGVISSINGCPPLLGVDNAEVEECLLFNNKVIEHISAHPELKLIILSARWAAHIEGSSYGVEPHKSIILIDTLSTNKASSSKDNVVVLARALKRTIEKLVALDRKVVLIGQVPEVGYNVESVSFVAEMTGREINELIAPSLGNYIKRNKRVSMLFEEIKDSVTIVEPYKLLCNEKRCDVERSLTLLYKDDDHLSSYGAKLVSVIFDSFFKN
jgi:peptidoglycan/LPS O-acetylase OafA/YrhL